MSDDKRPREWFIKNSFQDDHANIHGPKTKGCKVIEKSAYDSMAERLKATEEELEAYKKAKAENDERFQLEAGRERERAERAEADLQNERARELKHRQKNAVLKAEVEHLNKRILAAWAAKDVETEQLARERKINKIFLNELGKVANIRTEQRYSDEVNNAIIDARSAIARVKEIRK